MDEIEEIPFETAEGARPRSTLGDRMIVGLAALVLLGGVLIAAGNFLGGLAPDGTAASSAEPSAAVTPRPSRTPRPSPTPRPLRDVSVTPGTPTAPPTDGASQQVGWLEILSPTSALAAPSASASEVGQLAAGDILLVFLDPPGWASVTDSQTGVQSGFIQLEDATGRSVAEFYPADNQIYPGHVEGVWAGPDGLLATAWPPQRPYDPTTAMLVQSTDGEKWTRVDADPALTSTSPQMAWGPEGWVAVSVSPWDGTPWIWQSYDGGTWDALGKLTGVDSGWPNGIAASSLGYVLLFDENRYNGPVTTTWFSRDGIYWQESPDPFGRSEGQRMHGESVSVLATDAGFLAWTVSYDYGTAGQHRVAFSRDGLHWGMVPIEEDLLSGEFQVTVAGKTLIALGRTADGAVRAWSTDPADGASMQLHRDPALELAFEDTLATSLAANGTIAYALGYSQSSEGPVVWRSDGGAFRRLRLPEPIPFGASVSLGAVGPRGLVIIGSQGSVVETPVFWHLRDDGTWRRETDSIIPPIPDPTADECGSLPSTALEFAVLPPAWGPACFGDEPITFAAWAAPCEWCPDQPQPDPVGTWLLDSSPSLLLRPVAGGDWPFNEAVVHPDLELAAEPSSEWVRVTGHYDDPAAADCAFPFDPGNYYSTAQSAVTYCRQRFVVTELTVVDGP